MQDILQYTNKRGGYILLHKKGKNKHDQHFDAMIRADKNVNISAFVE